MYDTPPHDDEASRHCRASTATNTYAINAAGNQYSIVYSGLQHQTDEQMAHHPQIVWVEMKQFLAANMTVLHKVDSLTGLPLFMLAAVGKSSDLESVYNLLVEYPSVMFTVK